MPYINSADRKKFEKALDKLKKDKCIKTKGELNYLVTMLCKIYVMGREFDNYDTKNDVAGVLILALLEYARRNVFGYEDVKIQENGDI